MRMSMLAAVGCALLVCLWAGASAQNWREPVPVDPGRHAGFSTAGARAIVARTPDLAHAVYSDNDFSRVYYARSSDQGETWNSEPVSPDGKVCRYPAIDVPRNGADEPHFVWVEPRDGYYGDIWYRSPTGSLTLLSELTGPFAVVHGYPAVAVSGTGDLVVALWWAMASRSAPWFYSLRYRRSTDGGVSWGEEQALCETQWYELLLPPSLAFGAGEEGEVLHATWFRWHALVSFYWHQRSLDGGATWEEPTLLWSAATDEPPMDSPGSPGPVVAANAGGRVDIAWVHLGEIDINWLYVISSTDYGTSWQEEPVLIAGPEMYPGEAVVETEGRQVSYLVWHEYEEEVPTRLKYSRSVGFEAGWSAPAELPLPDWGSARQSPRLTVDSKSSLHLIWLDNVTGQNEVYSLWGQQMLSGSEHATCPNRGRKLARVPNSQEFNAVYQDNGNVFYT
ncbi:MAG TPA: exo-alpha-sialidase, partial [candidate division WOR-3 bacterium]|nr:exo-alpha-sialidase [candidate division WOR-3 bacterium]